MNIILLEKVHNLGTIGQQVNVKAGYARNYLYPQKKAVPATKENIIKFEGMRAELEQKAKEALQLAEQRKEQLADKTITITVNIGAEGKLFGSIGTRDIADAITAAGVEVEKHEVLLPEGPIRSAGEYRINLQLEGDVKAAVQLQVVAEEE